MPATTRPASRRARLTERPISTPESAEQQVPVPSSPAADSAAASPAAVLDRSPAERSREYRYRFGQSVVFGLPVVALQWFGRSLGGPEADRWVTLFQALLAGWVLYVAATGMMTEGVLILLAKRRVTLVIGLDMLVACLCTAGYVFGLALPLGLLTHRTFAWPATFHWWVLTLSCWSGVRWASLSKGWLAK